MIRNYTETLYKTATKIKDSEKIVLITHRRPDGDTLGSAFALAAGIKKLGKKVKVVNEEQITGHFAYLAKEIQLDVIDDPDCIISVDIAAADMMGSNLGIVYKDRVDICIDHHATNVGWAPVNCIKTYSACGEIIIDLLDKLAVNLDEFIARALYIAISTDTGCFKYGNTTAHTHTAAARLMEYTGDLTELNFNFFTMKSITQVKLEQLLYSKLKIFSDGRGAITSISIKEVEQLGATLEDLDGVADVARTIEGIEIGAFAKECEPCMYRISLRGNKPQYNVSEIAQLFDGGGHAGASGCTIIGDEGLVIRTMQKAIEDYIERNN